MMPTVFSFFSPDNANERARSDTCARVFFFCRLPENRRKSMTIDHTRIDVIGCALVCVHLPLTVALSRRQSDEFRSPVRIKIASSDFIVKTIIFHSGAEVFFFFFFCTRLQLLNEITRNRCIFLYRVQIFKNQ